MGAYTVTSSGKKYTVTSLVTAIITVFTHSTSLVVTEHIITLHWVDLSPTTSKGGAPMRKGGSKIVAFRDGEEDILYIVAGLGPAPSNPQPGAQYFPTGGDSVSCNENHMFSLSTSE